MVQQHQTVSNGVLHTMKTTVEPRAAPNAAAPRSRKPAHDTKCTDSGQGNGKRGRPSKSTGNGQGNGKRGRQSKKCVNDSTTSSESVCDPAGACGTAE